MNDKTAASRRAAKLATPTSLGTKATRDISGALNALVADFFALYLKTKNFHWHVSGPHFRDYHLLLDEQADQIYATTDPIAERVRKLGGTTLRSIGDIGKNQSIKDNDERFVGPGTTWDWQAPYFRRAFRNQVADLAEAIRDDRPVAIDGVEGRKAVDMALAARRSWETDTTVRMG